MNLRESAAASNRAMLASWGEYDRIPERSQPKPAIRTRTKPGETMRAALTLLAEGNSTISAVAARMTQQTRKAVEFAITRAGRLGYASQIETRRVGSITHGIWKITDEGRAYIGGQE